MAKLLKTSGRFFLLIFAASFTWYLASYAIYRLPQNNEYDLFYGEMVYKHVELGFTNRQFFEELHQNRVARITDGPVLFVSSPDHKKLWQNIVDMRKSDFTYKLKLKAKPLFFGGHGLAEVVSIERIQKHPIVRK